MMRLPVITEEPLIDLFSDNGHIWSQQLYNRQQGLLKRPPGRLRVLALIVVQPRLDQFQVVIAEIRPEEALDLRSAAA